MPMDFGLAPLSAGSQTPDVQAPPTTSDQRQPMDFGLSSSSTANSSKTAPSNNIGDKINQAAEDIRSRANAVAIGVSHGVDMFASTLGKAVFKNNTPNSSPKGSLTSILGDQATPEGIQKEYNTNTNTYNTNPDSVKHPLLSGAGNIVGGMLATAPAMIVAPEAAGGLMADSAADVGAGMLGQGLARAAGYSAANAVTGGLAAGVANTQGNSPDNLFNPQAAKTGAEIGAALGPIQQVIGGAAGNAANYEAKVGDLASLGYKGRVLATDVNQGVMNDAKEWITNNVLSKIPYINNTKALGVTGARQEQQAQLSQTIQQATGNFIQNLSEKNPGGNIQAYSNAVGNAWKSAQNTIGQLSDAFHKAAAGSGTDTIDTLGSQGQNAIQQFLQDNRKVLSNDTVNFLKDKAGQGNWDLKDLIGGTNADGNYQAGLKQMLFKESDRLGGDPTKTANYNASIAAKNLYNNVNQMVGNAVKGDANTTAAWNSYNTTTHNLLDMFSKQNSPNLANAVKDYDGSMNGVQTLFNKMVGNKLPGPIQDRYNSLIGQDGKDIVQNQQNTNALQSALKASQQPDGTLNLTSLMNNIKQQGTNIPKDFSDQMQGLFNLVNKNQQGLKGAIKEPGAVTGAIGAGLGYINPAMTAGVSIGATALSGLVSHAALGRTLMNLNKITGSNPGTSQYLMNQASKYLTSLGINVSHDDQGNTTLNRP